MRTRFLIGVSVLIALAGISARPADSERAKGKALAALRPEHPSPELQVTKAVGLLINDLQTGDYNRVAAHAAVFGQGDGQKTAANSVAQFFSQFRKRDGMPMAYVGDMVTVASDEAYVVSCTMLWYLEDAKGRPVSFKTPEVFHVQRGQSDFRVIRAVTTPLVISYLHDRRLLNRKLKDAAPQLQQP